MFKATILLATLKAEGGKEFSNTRVLSEILCDELSAHDTESEIIHLASCVIPPGTRSDMGDGDEWPQILDILRLADIIIFATPVWWGAHSSLMQRVMERLDELNDEIVATGKSEFLNKVGGMVITGSEDGAQHIIGNLANFMVWNGLTLPPACSLSFLTYYDVKTAAALKEKLLAQPNTVGMAKTMARNLVHMARLLKEHPLPVQEKAAQALR